MVDQLPGPCLYKDLEQKAVTSGGHCNGKARDQIWLFWEMEFCGLKDALLWENEGGGAG